MKKLSDFNDESAIVVVAKLIDPVMVILTNPDNKKFKGEKSSVKMFSGFLANSPKAMMEIFAILSEQDVENYHCDGAEVAKNLITLVADDRLIELFISQGQTGDANASGSASENIEE